MPTYDLEQRTLEFAIAIRKFVKTQLMKFLIQNV